MLILALVSVFNAFGTASAQNNTDQQLLEERRGPERASPRIMLVIDVSGSMSGDKLPKAVNAALKIVIFPTDALQVGVIAFDDVAVRITNPVDKSLWFTLPGIPSAKALRSQLKGLGLGGSTNPNGALRIAFLEKNVQSVVLITDGDFNIGKDPAVTVLAAQKDLSDKKRFIPTFAIMAIHASDSTMANLLILADKTGGQLCKPSDIPGTATDEPEITQVKDPPSHSKKVVGPPAPKKATKKP